MKCRAGIECYSISWHIILNIVHECIKWCAKSRMIVYILAWNYVVSLLIAYIYNNSNDYTVVVLKE